MVNWKSRKLWYIIGVIILTSCVILITGKDLPPNYADLIKWLSGFLLVANVGSKFANKGKNE